MSTKDDDLDCVLEVSDCERLYDLAFGDDLTADEREELQDLVAENRRGWLRWR